ncbi:acyl-CoA dehydratase activase [Campylobacter curvus]|uniref:Activator of 2-hydroxyglutaryl-CoA dehydratase n=1 Tax=Campylobacter curvus (strain 525.92) TaxID=360105 RepID=A7GWF4_CAMC5|nr:acyl-CoA dehydratase activase [Campylobacter curvus]EAU01142.1 activator of 2-hydroxyglutaryl-CoA dehydratase [Campylobacter curvus 525.92]
MHSVGIDIGSTSAKVAVFDTNESRFLEFFIMPTGWSTAQTAKDIFEKIKSLNLKETFFVATGYGRVSVPYANKTITEITCHALGAHHLFSKDCTVIDIGGQDTKAIKLEYGAVSDFTMNDKCSAGTGKFLEVMSNRLGVSFEELTALARNSDQEVAISSMCTVFAESEIISLIAQNVSRENIANAVINSAVNKISNLVKKQSNTLYFLSGGFSKNSYVKECLQKALQSEVATHENAIYCGSIGAALIGAKDQRRENGTK